MESGKDQRKRKEDKEKDPELYFRKGVLQQQIFLILEMNPEVFSTILFFLINHRIYLKDLLYTLVFIGMEDSSEHLGHIFSHRTPHLNVHG